MELKKIVNQGIKVEKKGQREKRRLSFLAGCTVGDELYFSSWFDRGFYKLNLQTGRCIPLAIFKEESEDALLYSQAIYFEKAVWLVPAYGQYIVKIDLETLRVRNYDLPANGKEILGKDGIRYIKFKCCYKKGASEFWLAPLGYNMLLKVDMAAEQIIEYNKLREKVIFKNGFSNFSDACFVNDEIWLCPRDSKELVVFDTVTGEFQFREWKHAKNDYRIVRAYKNQAVFLTQFVPESILLIAQDTYEERKIPIDAAWENKTDYMYLAADVIGRHMFLAPYQAHEYLAVDLETGEIQQDTRLHEYAQEMLWGQEQYQGSIKYGEKFVYVSDSKRMPVTVYDPEKNTVSYIEAAVDGEAYESFLVRLRQSDPDGFLKWAIPRDGEVVLEEKFPLTLFFSELDVLTAKREGGMDMYRTVGEEILLNAEKR